MARTRASAKQAGTRFETQCAEYLTDQLGVKITRMPKSGAQDKGDLYGVTIHGVPLVVECKSPGRTSSWSLSGWWSETLEETHHADTDYGILVIKRFNTSVSKSFCVVDDTMWERLGADKYFTPQALKSVPNSTWGKHIDTHGVCSIKRHGKPGFWVVCSLEDMSKIIHNERKVTQITLPEDLVTQLMDKGEIITTDDAGGDVRITTS